MAQPDLVAQKILGTDPQVGFGEGDVLPYRRHELDTRGLDAIERARTRMEQREDARKRNNEDYYLTTIKDLPKYRREVEATMGQKRNQIVGRVHQNIKRGLNPAADHDLQIMLSDYKQAAADSTQLHEDYEKEVNKPASKYVNTTARNGEILSNLTRNYDQFNQGDSSALGLNIAPDMSKHFNSDEYLNDVYKDRKPTEIANDAIKNGALGQEIHGKKVSARFWTKDANDNLVPGVGQEHIDELMKIPTEDPDTMQFRHSVNTIVDRMVRNKALELKASKHPDYEGLGVTDIEKRISSTPQDPYYKHYNKDKLQNDVVREQIEKFQTGGEANTIKSGHKYDNGSGTSQEDINARHQSIKKIISGDATEKGNLTNGVYGGKKVIDIELSQQQPEGRPVKKSAQEGALKYSNEDLPGVIKFKVEGEKGKIIEIQKPYKDKNEAYYILNNVYNTSPGQNKISKEELDKNRGNDSKVEKDTDPFKIKEEDQTEEDIL